MEPHVLGPRLNEFIDDVNQGVQYLITDKLHQHTKSISNRRPGSILLCRGIVEQSTDEMPARPTKP